MNLSGLVKAHTSPETSDPSSSHNVTPSSHKVSHPSVGYTFKVLHKATTPHTERFAAIQLACNLIPELVHIVAHYAEESYLHVIGYHKRFNFLTEVWEPNLFTPTQHLHVTAMIAIDDRIYAQLSDNYREYQLGYWQRGHAEWTPIPPPKNTGVDLCLATIQHKLYALGESKKEDFHCFNEQTHQWEQLAATKLRMYARRTITLNNQLYVIGQQNLDVSDMEVYNKDTNVWTVAPSLPEDTFHLQTFGHNGRIHAIGYKGNPKGLWSVPAHIGYCYTFSPDTWEWRPVPHIQQIMPPNWIVIHACVVYNDQLYLMGFDKGNAYGVIQQAYKLELSPKSCNNSHLVTKLSQMVPQLTNELPKIQPDIKITLF